MSVSGIYPSGGILTSNNPATGMVVWEGKIADAAAVDEAVCAARAAFPGWSRTPLAGRIAIVERYRDIVKENAEEFARCISEETGKALWDSKGEVNAIINKVAISIQAQRERAGEKSSESGGVRATLHHRPHGVAAVFGPYNFPAHLPNGHIVPALIAGNTVVLKPSDYTPGVAEYMAGLWMRAGLPMGVLNVVQGGRETGVSLASHPELNALYFTGSVETGHALHRQFAGRPEVMLALELGGNNPLIVQDVGDVEAAAVLAVQSAFATTGQRCTCARRLIVPRGAEGDRFIEALVALARRVRIGAYTDSPEPFMGPLISEREADKLMAAQASLLVSGAQSLLMMERPGGAFLTPGILDASEALGRPDREYFGPLLQVIRTADFDMAMAEANNTRYGLSAGIFTDDLALYNRFASEIKAGVLAWNRPTTGASSALPFGGVGASGNHRPSAYYAADYCAWPVAASESDKVLPQALPQGVV